MPVVRSAGDAVLSAFTQFMNYLPSVIGALVILIVGWLIANVLSRVVEKVLRAVGFERAVDRSGINGFLKRSGSSLTASAVLAGLIKWFVFLIFLEAAADALKVPQVTVMINNIVAFLPNVVVALLILVVGTFLANVVADLVRGSVSEIGVGNPNLFAALARYAIIGFAVVAALNQLMIAPVVVDALLYGLIAAVALALGLSFGLGGRDVAARITQSWYEGSQRMAGSAVSSRSGEMSVNKNAQVKFPSNSETRSSVDRSMDRGQ